MKIDSICTPKNDKKKPENKQATKRKKLTITAAMKNSRAKKQKGSAKRY